MTMHEIMILSRGGQGGVTMAKMIAFAAVLGGWDAATIPKYGAERRGAPVQTSIRLSDEKLKLHSQVRVPDHVIALDKSLIPKLITKKAIKDENTFAVNAPSYPDVVTEYHPKKVGYINALAIAKELDLVRAGIPILSTPMIGAFIKVTGLLELDHMEEAIKHYVKHEEFLERNLKALKEAYQKTEVKVNGK